MVRTPGPTPSARLPIRRTGPALLAELAAGPDAAALNRAAFHFCAAIGEASTDPAAAARACVALRDAAATWARALGVT